MRQVQGLLFWHKSMAMAICRKLVILVDKVSFQESSWDLCQKSPDSIQIGRNSRILIILFAHLETS